MNKTLLHHLKLTLIRQLLKYLAKLVDQRLQEPKDDLIGRLVAEQLVPGHIEKSDAVQIAFLLLVAGNATMVNMIALVRHFRSVSDIVLRRALC
jgi:cytochrome P450